MSAAPARGSLVAVGLLGVIAAAGLLAGEGRGQPAKPAAERGEGKAGRTRVYRDAGACIKCHFEGPGKVLSGVTSAKPVPALVRQIESRIWDEKDRHRLAYQVLVGKRGVSIGKLLGIDVTKDRSCLACHSTGFLPDDAEFRGKAEEAKQQGVSCIACHGAYLQWIQEHGVENAPNPKWRSKTAEEKQSDYGMTDLRNPAIRAGTCDSCHVGNAKEGKVVTHRMYAAGHPPLPGIEAATFSRAMTPHWLDPKDVPLFREDPKSAKLYHYDPAELGGTRLAVIGGVVALRDSMNLLAATMAPGEPKTSAWPDFAAFDCAACHHDLRVPGTQGWRGVGASEHPVGGQSVRGSSGRPQVRPWPFALARVGLVYAETLAGDRELRPRFEKGVAKLQGACIARPFGDARAVAEAAREIAAWSDDLRKILEKTKFDPSSAPRLLRALTLIPDDEQPDFDSARQIAWAFRTIYAELKPQPSKDDPIRSVLGELDAALRLERNAGRDAKGQRISKNPVEDDLAVSLERAAAYDPAQFQAKLKELRDRLPVDNPAPAGR